MKIFLHALLLSVCSIYVMSAQKVEPQILTFADGITYNIKRVQNSLTSGPTPDDMYTHIAKKGKFKVMLVEFTNSNQSDFEIDFKNVFLIDKNNNKYRVSSVAQAYFPNLANSQYKVTLRPDKTKLYFAQFRPPFPKKEKIERIEVNGEIIILNEPK